MRVHYLQHVPFEGLGSIEPWLIREGHKITATRQFVDEKLPGISEFDWLVVLGGPMSANDDGKLGWLSAEKVLIQHAIEAGKCVLGICLGAQLIASVRGAEVFKNTHREIGWYPIERVAAASEHEIGRIFPTQLDVLHWHGETFDLPSGATLLASSAACRHQAFAIGTKVIGLQFHLEQTRESAEQLVASCRDELIPGKYVQSAEEILASDERFTKINHLMNQMLYAMSKH
jgi:GMP synthase-like glutamine amidotransferase